ncbi:polysaccharide pyruvyl transferase family protein [Anoxybacillus suryakundensis]|uniref:Polysaccharide pyruvyl transferase family protein WcaK n=1 Tax=Anoxybacillus suryakundensis TaxID=1325335 RepID=A0A0K6GM39_9BACL|nr:polysaccharide pyruvyl transferase family protein [Anoxybacillus suryakundensis]CUA79613.1 Polysaccharide pyruvyl transferase family protein WcaK [Anoxybacillus suryakundensis]
MTKKLKILFKGAFNFFNFGDDLLFISVLEFIKKELSLTDNDIDVFINKSEKSIEYLNYSSPFVFNNSYELKDVLREIHRRFKQLQIPEALIKIILLFSLLILLFSIIFYKLTKRKIFFNKYFSFVSELNMIHFIGGGYFADKWRGKLLYEYFNLMFIKIINPKVKVLGTGLGLGPFESKLNILVFRLFANYFDYIFVREETSLQFLKKLNIKGKCDLLGDDVFLLLPLIEDMSSEKLQSKRFGLNLKDFEEHNYIQIKENLGRIIREAKRNGFNIEFYAFGQAPGPRDDQVTQQIIESLNIDAQVYNPYKMGWIPFMQKLSNLDLGLGFAYHFNVILSLYKKPIISVFSGHYYQQKINGVMSYLNKDAQIISINDLENLEINYLLNFNNGVNKDERVNHLYNTMKNRYSDVYRELLNINST